MTAKKDTIILPEGYIPTPDEEYMSPIQLEYFKQKLLAWKDQLNQECRQTLEHLKDEDWNQPDSMDQASVAADTALELRTRDRYRKLIDKINAALFRIENGSYGYCEDTGEPIGLKRLEARLIATLSLKAQEQHEKFERTHFTDDVE